MRQQALIMGFSDTFAVIGLVLALAAVAILFTRGAGRKAAAGALNSLLVTARGRGLPAATNPRA